MSTLYEIDFVQLEICVAAYLSQDPVLLKELHDGFDLHSDNQKRFGLPSRLLAKTFVFRILYGGSDYSFSRDPEFAHVSTSKAFWKRAIDAFYNKYRGIHAWHVALIQGVVDNGFYTSPTGREFKFTGLSSGRFPDTDIKNYIVQGTGADLLSICRVRLYEELRVYPEVFKFRGTVHDSILVEIITPKKQSQSEKEAAEETQSSEELYFIEAVKRTWTELPRMFESRFGIEWNVPCRVEIKKGPTWGDMTTIYKG